MSDGTIRREQGAYRRGIVLGLTLGEIVTLLLFVLLLVLAASARHAREQQEALTARAAHALQAQEQTERQLAEVRAVVGGTPAEFDDLWQSLRIA